MFANWRAGAALLLISLGWLTPAQAVDIQRWQTAHGAKVLFVASHDNPLLDVRVDFDAGNRRDSADKPGVSDLTLTLLDAGTDALSEEAIKARLADLAAQLSGSSDIERAGVGLRTLSDPAQREPALALLADMLARPSFPAALLAREKAQMLTALREAEDDPAGRGERALRRLMYGAHPYALSARINADSVRRISRDDVLRFWRAHYTARRAVVSLVGDISRADAERIAEQLTARLPAGADALKPIPPVSAPAQGGREQLLHSGTQTHLFLGMPVLRRDDPDYFPLLVGNYVLGGGGFDSRLMKEVRDKRGLTYGVSSHFSPMEQAGEFEIALSTRNAQADTALKVVEDTIAQFIAEGPSEDELAQAKRHIIGGFPLRLDSNLKLMGYVSMLGQYDLPNEWLNRYPDKVAAVTLAQVRDAWKRRLSLAALSQVRVGPKPAP
ncbi:M16 family metallopeptidase [Rivihabitans pingtungensis]|jgi:zinc protease|uniref:Zinc protease n=1 Tax=Rivihabitans pingtungensis TaxID=1054498 RepID=A0A318KW38_9NEIS|nr:pitrilysin family protein [Rivihabitans pingtungensis]MCK6436350.1 insulinase family protein [Rivihabitans pingtungensis]PXX79925.1 zinc protease [Rivihabitans pingtungensis]HNX71766.1 pitrilysin family protein [Rivihabitans pingtungensis]